jgi:hypothetical protein
VAIAAHSVRTSRTRAAGTSAILPAARTVMARRIGQPRVRASFEMAESVQPKRRPISASVSSPSR